MNLSAYDAKHVRVLDTRGGEHTGVAKYCSSEYCLHEYGGEEDGVVVDGCLIRASRIASIGEIEAHGTSELRSERLTLRRYRPEDAAELYRQLGKDPEMYRYSGWNPYATEEMARETVRRFIDSYADARFYGWVLDFEGVPFGTIGAYDYRDGMIEVGFSVAKPCWGRGYATEALRRVLAYLTENEGIRRVTAWCAAENTGSQRVLEKAGMRRVRVEKGALQVGGRTYDKWIYEYGPE